MCKTVRTQGTRWCTSTRGRTEGACKVRVPFSPQCWSGPYWSHSMTSAGSSAECSPRSGGAASRRKQEVHATRSPYRHTGTSHRCTGTRYTTTMGHDWIQREQACTSTCAIHSMNHNTAHRVHLADLDLVLSLPVTPLSHRGLWLGPPPQSSRFMNQAGCHTSTFIRWYHREHALRCIHVHTS